MPTPRFVGVLADTIKDTLGTLRIKCEIRWERVTGTNLVRIFVISKQFRKMRHSERQNLVWRIAENTLTEAQLYKISMILTLSPDELGDE